MRMGMSVRKGAGVERRRRYGSGVHHVKIHDYEKRRRKGGKSGFGFFTATTADARFLYDEVIEKKTYLREGLVTLPECGATVIDVGANVGLFTCLCAAEVHTRDAHVIAVEPNPSCCTAMELNLYRHDATDVLIVYL